MKSIEFSKKIIRFTFFIFFIVIIASIVMGFMGKDTSVFCYSIPSVGGVVGSSVIFYYRKAQVENAVKVQIYALDQMYNLRDIYKDYESDLNMNISSTESEIQSVVGYYKDESTTPVSN